MAPKKNGKFQIYQAIPSLYRSSRTAETVHPAGMHSAIVEAVLAGDPEAAFSTMKAHSIEFGEILVKMEKAYREKKFP